MFVPIMHQKAILLEKQEPCKTGCQYALDVGMLEHSCGGLYCDHYREEYVQSNKDLRT